MSRTIKSVLFGLLLCTGLLSCEKEYSVENGNGGAVSSGTAVYNFDGAPGACTLPVINGTYQVGTAMGVGNNIILTVDVITPGTYTISTGSVNGVTFSASSSFAQAGPAIIQLAASGKPLAAGPFNYTPGGNGCAFSVTFASSGTGGGTSTGTAIYTCTSMDAAGIYTAGSTVGTSNTLTLHVDVQTGGTYTITTGNPDGFSFSGSGNLPIGNNQSITLTGIGVPTNPGTVSITIGTGCAVTITVGGTSGGTTGDYLTATIAGTTTNQFNKNLQGIFSPFSTTTPTPGTLGLSGEAATGSEVLEVDFISATGNVNAATYKNLSTTNVISGVIIQYTDNAGDSWLSSTTVANSCTATITSLTSTRATGTFSGTLYSSDETVTKVVTAGLFSIPIQ